ncbi:DUF7523 family protein [Halosolutus gelatinilyticus]|uniref:DUF7523 family protein n=1 Tax=Halosolutus gelatinilyticus TaxID=2931975 RepID=UPI001FF2FEBF|nr:hypothetical protein [Halosolutus gelatinilyticus]
MSLASETRRAVDEHPFLVTALRAGVVNYTAAARFLDVDGETEAVATAIRRYAEELPVYDPTTREVRVRMESGIGPVEETAAAPSADGLLTVGGVTLAPGDGDRTAIVATGDVEPTALAETLRALAIADVSTTAAAVADGTMIVVVDRLDGAMALRTVESALERIPRA